MEKYKNGKEIKENAYITDPNLNVCRITTALTESMNKELKFWKESVSLNNVILHDYEVTIDNNAKLIDLLSKDYFVYYNRNQDITYSKGVNPKLPPYANVGYFWARNLHTKQATPISRLIWEFMSGEKIPAGFVIDHNNDKKNFNLFSNLTPMTDTQNTTKLKYYGRIATPYSITLISNPLGKPIKLLRFIDDMRGEQELLVYDTAAGIENILTDLNSFKAVNRKQAIYFKRHFEQLKKDSKNYIACTKQAIVGDEYERDIFHWSVDWNEIYNLTAKAASKAVSGK